MAKTQLQALEQKVDELIELCDQLDLENRSLKSQAHAWREERDQLVAKNMVAREKVEAMIQRLRALEQES